MTLIAVTGFAVGCGRTDPAAGLSPRSNRVDSEAATESMPLASRAGSLEMPAPTGPDAATQPLDDEGQGPGEAGDRFDEIVDNPFFRVADQPLSTFSIDVDTASYSKVRQFLLDRRSRPRPDAVRIEELVNYFDYNYEPPAAGAEAPFATELAVTECPWTPQHRLARIALKGRVIENDARPASNLVFLVDSSGSMNRPNKLPLLSRALQLMLTKLGTRDRVAIVAYAGSAGLVLPSTSASDAETILQALTRLRAGGSTNGGEGLQLAYRVAQENFIEGGVNRVLLCTDGDFNVGRTGTDQLLDLVEKEAADGVELTVLGFGMGNHNDAMLEQISGRGNGNYAFIDTYNEAQKALVQQLSGTLVTIAKDVKIQIEFNPLEVAAYRLIGYENRLLENQDFNDDQKDAGEIGAGHAVTALYEIVPVGVPLEGRLGSDELKYQQPAEPTTAAASGELCTVKLRFKRPDQDTSELLEFALRDDHKPFAEADADFQFAAAVANFGMQLRESPHAGTWSLDTVEEVAASAVGEDPWGLRQEFVELVAAARVLPTAGR